MKQLRITTLSDCLRNSFSRLRLSAKQSRERRQWRRQCAARTCSYYQYYLLRGADDLTHAAYHHAEQICVAYQMANLHWAKIHRTECAHIADGGWCNHRNPFEQHCEKWERIVRAQVVEQSF